MQRHVECRLRLMTDIQHNDMFIVKAWCFPNGYMWRPGLLPTAESRDGTKRWYRGTKLHRDNDLPAVEHPSGAKKWYKDGERCRLPVI